MFYQFRQNNSGGRFRQDLLSGISICVIIEADSPEDADRRAERIGLYFNGCESGIDCPCCGDRWSELWNDDKGTEIPCYYDTPLDAPAKEEGYGNMVWPEADRVFVHYKDGRVAEYLMKKSGFEYLGAVLKTK